MSDLGNCKICYAQLTVDAAGMSGADMPSDVDPTICASLRGIVIGRRLTPQGND